MTTITSSGSGRGHKSGQTRKIYMDRRGRRYVKPKELFQDPDIERRLESADKLAQALELKRGNRAST